MMDYIAQCAPQVSPVLMQALVRQESDFNPYAIGIDSGGEVVKPQPSSLQEAVKTANELHAAGKKFSVGIAQIHISNVQSAGLTFEQIFDPCRNLSMGQSILFSFYKTAIKEGYAGIDAVWAALRGYNSGNVHKTVSDKYAQDIFMHMQKLQAATNQQQPTKTTPASLNTGFAQLTPSISTTAGGNQLQGIAGPAKKAPIMADESPDIFQREESQKGL